MRKVKFPMQLDLLDIVGHTTRCGSQRLMIQVTDEMRAQLGPVNSITKQIVKEREDRARVAKRNQGHSPNEDTGEIARRADEKARVDGVVASQGLDLSRIGPNPSALYELCGKLDRLIGRRLNLRSGDA